MIIKAVRSKSELMRKSVFIHANFAQLLTAHLNINYSSSSKVIASLVVCSSSYSSLLPTIIFSNSLKTCTCRNLVTGDNILFQTKHIICFTHGWLQMKAPWLFPGMMPQISSSEYPVMPW